MIRYLWTAAVLLLLSVGGASAQGSKVNIQCLTGVAGFPWDNCSTQYPFPVTVAGGVSANLAPFTPSTTGARGTPLTVTTSDSSGNLPTNTGSVLIANVGTNPMYCNLNGIAATVADQLITSGGGWVNFGVPAGSTTLHCIATGGSTTANTVGGSGLAAGTGAGGSGGGGGGSVTQGTVPWVVSGQGTAGSAASGVVTVQGIASMTPVQVSQATAGNLNATVVGTGTFAVQAAQTGTWTVQPGNTANTTAWLVTGTGGTFPVTQATSSNLKAQVDPLTAASWGIGTSTQNSASVANGHLILGQFNTTPTTITSGNMSPIQMDNAGNLLVNIKAGSSSGAVAQGSTTSGQSGPLIQGAVTTAAPTYTTAQTNPLSLTTGGLLRVTDAAAEASLATIATNSSTPLPAQSTHTVNIGAVDSINEYPATAVPYTASATGTTAATTATLAGASSVTTYICGMSVRSNATAAATGNITVTGTISATMNFTHWTAPNASGIGITEMIFKPCVPASGTNQSVAVVSPAPGTGGVVSVTAWGYKL